MGTSSSTGLVRAEKGHAALSFVLFHHEEAAGVCSIRVKEPWEGLSETLLGRQKQVQKWARSGAGSEEGQAVVALTTRHQVTPWLPRRIQDLWGWGLMGGAPTSW